ncbi:MAG: DNA-binding response regulator [Saprospiraceae bacterium]|nr:MAG: DNA-binding response regulator [Saprospiraceae bacterium]
MKVLLIEDELPAAKQLTKLIRQIRPDAQIIPPLDSVESAVLWLQTNEAPDLIFMDIQLADGLSFDIFQQVDVRSPVIFTTAYDQYTLKAFKVNSVDYLLKPVEPDELAAALDKFDRLFQQREVHLLQRQTVQQLLASFQKQDYKERFMVKIGQQLTYIAIKDIHYFYSDDGLVYAQTIDNKRHLIDYTLDQLSGIINPDDFFRINRKIIICIRSINKIHPYFNSRFLLELKPITNFDVIVSRDRTNDFKAWLNK